MSPVHTRVLRHADQNGEVGGRQTAASPRAENSRLFTAHKGVGGRATSFYWQHIQKIYPCVWCGVAAVSAAETFAVLGMHGDVFFCGTRENKAVDQNAVALDVEQRKPPMIYIVFSTVLQQYDRSYFFGPHGK